MAFLVALLLAPFLAPFPAGASLLFGADLPTSAATAATATTTATADAPADHVVLISVDGLRPEFYLDPSWPAPMMQQMRREGASARGVLSVYPSVTYPSHTTMITGALPARHGIYYNSPYEPAGPTGRWYWEASAIRVPTLWSAVRDAGLTSASIGWPVSVGAPIDRNLPEIWSLDPKVDPIDAMRAVEQPPGLIAELEREATGRLSRETFTIAHLTRDDRAGAMAAYLLERYRPSLLTVHLIEADHFQHEEGRDGPMVRRAVATVDRAIAQVVEAAGRAGILGRTAFVVTGDHGHDDRQIRLAPNVWLAEAGLLRDPEAGSDAAGETGGAGETPRRAAFHTSGAAAFLHLQEPDGPQGQALAERVRQVLDGLPAGVRSLFRIMDRAELDRRGAAPEAILSLAAEPGVDFTEDAEPPALRPIAGATHGYPPERETMHTGLVAWGAGVRPGAVAPLLRLTDVAPLVSHLLGIPFDAPDGTVPLGLLGDAEPASH